MKKMMYNLRRTISIALSLMLVIVLFTACADSPNDSSSSTNHPQQSETVSVTEAPIESQTNPSKADETTAPDTVEADETLPLTTSEPQTTHEVTSESTVSLEPVTDSPSSSTSSTDRPKQSETVSVTDAPKTDSSKANETTTTDTVEADAVLPWAISEPRINYEETPENAVSLKLAADSLSATGAEFKMSNLSDNVVSTGNDYIIEVFRDGKWNYIDIGIVMFPAEAFIYEAGQTYDVNINWTNYYGELPAADYRIIKEYSFDGSLDKYYCICEFSIVKEQ